MASPRCHEVKHLGKGLLDSCQSEVSAQGQKGLAEGLQKGGEVLWEEAGPPTGEIVLGAEAGVRVTLNHV